MAAARPTQKITSSGQWGAVVSCDEAMIIIPGVALHLTNVSVGPKTVNMRVRTVLTMSFIPRGSQQQHKIVVGSLAAGRLEHFVCDIYLQKDGVYTFDTTGGNTFQLHGRFEKPHKSSDPIPQTKIIKASRSDVNRPSGDDADRSPVRPSNKGKEKAVDEAQSRKKRKRRVYQEPF